MMKAFSLSICSALALLLPSQAQAQELFVSDEAGAPPAAGRFPQFEFPGGTLVDFVVAFRELASAHYVNPPNIVVSPSAESQPVPPIDVRSVSAEILLQLVARLAGANLETIVPDDENSSAAVYIFDAPNSPDLVFSGLRYGLFDGQSGAATGASGASSNDGSGSLLAGSLGISPPAPEAGAGPAETAQFDSLQPVEVTHDPSGLINRPLLNGVFDTALPAPSPAPTRFVIPMFVGLLFDESEEGRQKQDELHVTLVEYVHRFFPDAKPELSMHGESGVLIVESSSQAAVDFVRAFLDARREAEIFRLKQQQVDAGVRSAEVLLEQSPQRR
ncbi:MAG TPA: hypothetical protein VMN36_14255 [Verrucomicrobiales bacterium]|nr:hypothetical protein [Verrucomicrobiales bacterium]